MNSAAVDRKPVIVRDIIVLIAVDLLPAVFRH